MGGDRPQKHCSWDAGDEDTWSCIARAPRCREEEGGACWRFASRRGPIMDIPDGDLKTVLGKSTWRARGELFPRTATLERHRAVHPLFSRLDRGPRCDYTGCSSVTRRRREVVLRNCVIVVLCMFARVLVINKLFLVSCLLLMWFQKYPSKHRRHTWVRF